MHCRLLFIILFQLFLFQPLFSQTSVPATEKNSTQKESKEAVVEYLDWSDSVKRKELLRQMEQSGKNFDAFLVEMREREKKEKRRMWIRIGAGAILLFALFFAIARRSSAKKK